MASLAYAIDRELGLEWAKDSRRGDSVRLQVTAEAVNVANRTLRERKPGTVILVRPLRQFWASHPDVVTQFPVNLQHPPSTFRTLIPVTTRLSRVDYSTIGGGNPRKITVTLWPVAAPQMNSPALTTSEFGTGIVGFRFKHWKELPPGVQAQHNSLADRIAAYVDSAHDAIGTIHIVAAPELILAPEAHRTINAAVAARRNAAWILFPGSYHIERNGGVVNRAAMRVGGVLDKSDLFVDPGCGAVSAVKLTPFEFKEAGGLHYVEDIDCSTSSVHLLDTDVGRIAVMICRDFLDVALTKEVVSMGTDHLFVLSMSPDRGTKFRLAMEIASDYRTAFSSMHILLPDHLSVPVSVNR